MGMVLPSVNHVLVTLYPRQHITIHRMFSYTILFLTMCPQQTVRLSPKDAATPVLQTKTKAQRQMPNLGAEVLMAARVQGSRYSRNYCKSVRNGVFLVISVNKDVTVISEPSPLGQPGRRRISV